MSKAADLSPTSELPFAARRCDVPDLEFLKNYRSNKVENAAANVNEAAQPAIDCAWSMVTINERLSKIDDLLGAVESLFEKAYRGDTSEQSPTASFSMAMSLLGLSRELIQVITFDSDDALERVCKDVTALPALTIKKGTRKAVA